MANISITASTQSTSLVSMREMAAVSHLGELFRRFFERRTLIIELDCLSEQIRQDIGLTPADLAELRNGRLFSLGTERSTKRTRG